MHVDKKQTMGNKMHLEVENDEEFEFVNEVKESLRNHPLRKL